MGESLWRAISTTREFIKRSREDGADGRVKHPTGVPSRSRQPSLISRLAADKKAACVSPFKAHARFLFLFSSVFKSLEMKQREGNVSGNLKKKKERKRKKKHKLHFRLTKQTEIKDVEVASSWLDFLLLLSGAMDLREG